MVDPSCRPNCNQILEHISSVSAENGIDLSTEIDFEFSTNSATPLFDMSPQEQTSATPSPQHKPGKLEGWSNDHTFSYFIKSPRFYILNMICNLIHFGVGHSKCTETI